MQLSLLAKYSNGLCVGPTKDRPYLSSEQISYGGLVSLSIVTQDLVVVAIQHYKNGQKPVYRRRTRKTTNGLSESVHLLGWRNETSMSVMVVHEDISLIESLSEWNDRSEWFYEPQWLPSDDRVVSQI